MAMPTRMFLAAIVGIELAVAASASTNSAQPEAARSARPEAARGASPCPSATRAVPATELRSGTSTLTCGLVGRLVTSNGVGVLVQPPGHGVSASADSSSGGVTLNVFTSAQGLVTAEVTGADPQSDPKSRPQSKTVTRVETTSLVETAPVLVSSALAASSDPACRMTAWHFNGWRWAPGVAAKFLVNTAEARPRNISAASFLSIQKAAAKHITSAYNNCGIVAHPVLSLQYAGTTRYNSNINGGSNTCAARDGRSVLDFGKLSGSAMALNCTWYQRSGGSYGRITDSDTRFDNTNRAWVTTTTGCRGARYDLFSVATHEMGHLVGLGHVGEARGSDLTMSPMIAPCSGSARTLGRGDIKALMIPY